MTLSGHMDDRQDGPGDHFLSVEQADHLYTSQDCESEKTNDCSSPPQHLTFTRKRTSRITVSLLLHRKADAIEVTQGPLTDQ